MKSQKNGKIIYFSKKKFGSLVFNRIFVEIKTERYEKSNIIISGYVWNGKLL
jgi:hypothetical protein